MRPRTGVVASALAMTMFRRILIVRGHSHPSRSAFQLAREVRGDGGSIEVLKVDEGVTEQCSTDVPFPFAAPAPVDWHDIIAIHDLPESSLMMIDRGLCDRVRNRAACASLLRWTKIPVLFVGTLASSAERSIQRIVFPVDFSDPCRRGLYAAAELAVLLKCRLLLLHVFPPLDCGTMEGVELERIRKMGRGLKLRRYVQLREWAKLTRHRMVTVKIVEGENVDTAISAMTNAGDDLLVLPSCGWGAAKPSPVGGSAQRLLRLAPLSCLVLTREFLRSRLHSDGCAHEEGLAASEYADFYRK